MTIRLYKAVGVVRDNVVGLARFTRLLVQATRPAPKPLPELQSRQDWKGDDRYSNILRQPTRELGAPVFCPRCHRLTARIHKLPQGVEVSQGGSRITFVNNTLEKGGKRLKGIPLRCPVGHVVEVG